MTPATGFPSRGYLRFGPGSGTTADQHSTPYCGRSGKLGGLPMAGQSVTGFCTAAVHPLNRGTRPALRFFWHRRSRSNSCAPASFRTRLRSRSIRCSSRRSIGSGYEPNSAFLKTRSSTAALGPSLFSMDCGDISTKSNLLKAWISVGSKKPTR